MITLQSFLIERGLIRPSPDIRRDVALPEGEPPRLGGRTAGDLGAKLCFAKGLGEGIQGSWITRAAESDAGRHSGFMDHPGFMDHL